MIEATQELILTVTAAEVNVIMGALGEAPYRVAAPLIEKLRAQISAAVPEAFQQPGMMPTANGLDKPA